MIRYVHRVGRPRRRSFFSAKPRRPVSLHRHLLTYSSGSTTLAAVSTLGTTYVPIAIAGTASLNAIASLTVAGVAEAPDASCVLTADSDLTIDNTATVSVSIGLAGIAELTVVAVIVAIVPVPDVLSTMQETLFIDNVDLRTVVACVQIIDGMFQTSDAKGDNVVIPAVPGELFVEKSVNTGVISYGLIFEGANHDLASLNQRFFELKQIVKPGQHVDLRRRIAFSTGVEDHIAKGEYLSGLEPAITINRASKVALAMRVLDGVWYGTSVSGSSPGTITVAGEADTHRITVTMSAGTLINTTTGDALTYTGTGTAVIDVENFSATSSGVDVSGAIIWNKSYPMTLAPGANVLTGTATIAYTPAYY